MAIFHVGTVAKGFNCGGRGASRLLASLGLGSAENGAVVIAVCAANDWTNREPVDVGVTIFAAVGATNAVTATVAAATGLVINEN